jgi:hypothetical protein
MATIRAHWPKMSSCQKTQAKLPPECVSWQEVGYNRKPVNLPVSNETWNEVRVRYERK